MAHTKQSFRRNFGFNKLYIYWYFTPPNPPSFSAFVLHPTIVRQGLFFWAMLLSSPPFRFAPSTYGFCYLLSCEAFLFLAMPNPISYNRSKANHTAFPSLVHPTCHVGSRLFHRPHIVYGESAFSFYQNDIVFIVFTFSMTFHIPLSEWASIHLMS